MYSDKVVELANRIEAAFMELAEVTGDGHVSAFVVNGAFLLTTWNDGTKNIDIFRTEANNE